MKVSNINSAGSQKVEITKEKASVKNQKIDDGQNPKVNPETKEVKVDPAVVYEKSDEAKALDNAKNTKTIDFLKQQSEERINNFKKMIYQMLEKQGYHFNKLAGNQVFDKDGNLIKPEDIKVDDVTRLKAQEAISEGGEYSVDAVAGRIMDFAKALAGGDKSKIATLRKAVQDGFKQAKQMLGGTLPEISMKTYDKIMAEFDEWEKPTEEKSTEEKPEVEAK